MSDSKMASAVLGVATVLGLVSSAYMHYLQAPSVAAVRPELLQVGLWDAMFSGRFTEWLYLNEPAVGFVLTIALYWVMAGVFWLTTQ